MVASLLLPSPATASGGGDPVDVRLDAARSFYYEGEVGVGQDRSACKCAEPGVISNAGLLLSTALGNPP